MKSASLVSRASLLAILAVFGATSVAAEVPGVSTLIEQGRYWQRKGRTDLANQAFRRALALDPGNAEVRKAMASPAKPAAAKPQPKAPAKAPAQAKAAPQQKPSATPAPAQAAAPRSTAKAAPAGGSGGDARAAGFRSFDDGNIATAERQFQTAISRNRRDADALGGLGLVRLRQSRFPEARDLLEQASRLGDASKWTEALATARYFGGLADARTMLANGRLAEAQSQVEALVRSGYSDRAPALELLAQVYEKQGRFADAADLYRQASEGGKALDTRLQGRVARDSALHAAASGDDATAQQEFVSGMMLDPTDPWIRYEYARFLIKRGRQAEVGPLLTAFSSSTDPDWLYAGALVNEQVGQAGTAYGLIERIPEGQRTQQMRNFAMGLFIDSAVERAKALATSGREGDALAALRQIAAKPDTPPEKQAAIADALFELGDTGGAAALAQRALASNISDPASYEPIVRVLAKTGNDALAMTAAQRAARLAGDTPDGQSVVGGLNGIMAATQADRLRQGGQYASAFDLLQSAWTNAPGNPEVLSALARLYQSGGLNAQAAQTFQLVLAQSPRDKGALTGLIETAGAAGDRDLARDTIERALQLSPNDHEIYLAAARMEQSRGDEGAALKYLKRARALYSQTAGIGDLSAANPFGAASQGNNPFRDRQRAAPAMINPFALGKGTRALGAGGFQPSTYGGGQTAPAFAGSYQPSELAAAPAGPGMGWTAQGGAVVPAMPGMPAMPADSGGYAAPGGGYPAPGGGYPAPGGYPAMASAGPGFGSSFGATDTGDPVLNRIEADIEALSRESGPQAQIRTGYRERSGEVGLSALKEVTGSAELSTGFAGGRISAKATAVALDSGRPTGSGLARFGRNGTAEAQGIVDEEPSRLAQAETQHASGVAVSAAYRSSGVEAEIGSTPIGAGDTKLVWRGAVTPRFSPNATGSVWLERKPVSDSVLSYAGTRDPISGYSWGQVMRTGAGASFSYDKDGTGFYGDGSYSRYKGLNVANNKGFQLNVGGYMPLYQGENATFFGGTNINYQRFDNNQNYFTYGHGGYFSPQSFFSIAFPLRYAYNGRKLKIRGSIAPGYQSFEQDQVGLYPDDPNGQALLDGLKALNSDVRNYYDSLSKTGFAFSAEGSAYYNISPRTQIGGDLSMSTFGSYDEFKSSFGIKQSIGGK